MINLPRELVWMNYRTESKKKDTFSYFTLLTGRRDRKSWRKMNRLILNLKCSCPELNVILILAVTRTKRVKHP